MNPPAPYDPAAVQDVSDDVADQQPSRPPDADEATPALEDNPEIDAVGHRRESTGGYRPV
ncbi:MAG TPA: hypothetical protein VGH27_02265 [Streptosporangiaceae bacterium]|jgi:hypothetical protein